MFLNLIKIDQLYEDIKSKYSYYKIAPYNKKKDLVNKLELLSNKSNYPKYYNDMFKVVKDLDALTPRQLKIIRNITSKTCDKNIKEIEKNIPQSLLTNLLKTLMRSN